jgi:hypothetical protein
MREKRNTRPYGGKGLEALHTKSVQLLVYVTLYDGTIHLLSLRTIFSRAAISLPLCSRVCIRFTHLKCRFVLLAIEGGTVDHSYRPLVSSNELLHGFLETEPPKG